VPKIVAVVGPTASGKTDLGCRLCQRFGGEIVSVDAKQVYRGMDIGTAKEPDLPVAQHLLDIRDPGQKITVGEFQAEAYAVIDRLLAGGTLPVLVGGSGLYAEAVMRGYVFGGPGGREAHPRYQVLALGISVDRDALKTRAASRLETRLQNGLIAEVQGLLDAGVDPDWLYACGIEYRYFSQFLLGNSTREEAIQKTLIATNQFIKRQYTWWRRNGEVVWVADYVQAEAAVTSFLRYG
jgi:tRNA dimethylallyltransferase